MSQFFTDLSHFHLTAEKASTDGADFHRFYSVLQSEARKDWTLIYADKRRFSPPNLRLSA